MSLHTPRATPPRLCIPIEVRPEGGVYTFIGNLLAWLTANGHPYTTDLEADYDVLFTNSWVIQPSVVKRVKRARPAIRVVHRVDGSAEDYGGNPDSDRIQARVNLLADVTIFQSQYSKLSTREKFPVVVQDGPVIYNPVDTALFQPDAERPLRPGDRPRVACASWSVNPRKGTGQIDAIADANPDLTFALAGRFDRPLERPNIVRLGHLTRAEMAAMLRSCDLFLNLSENDPCPNVVLEAMASGLPVVYRHSGGVPELVGDCGVAIDGDDVSGALAAALAQRPRLSRAARARVDALFTPEIIFPQYLAAIERSERRPLPSALEVIRLAGRGYPVLPTFKGARRLAAAAATRLPSWLKSGAGRRTAVARKRVGWVTYDSYPRRKQRFEDLDPFTGMRVGNVAAWMNANQHDIVNELYDPDAAYDVVVFQKMMNARCQQEADAIRRRGGKVVFDANVNYYETWGDYFIPGTQPTDEQQRDAIRMTTNADWVVADSTFLEGVIRPLNPRVTWIPDNVNMHVYGERRQHQDAGPLKLVWSGVGKKAAHLLAVVDAFAALTNAELVLVVDEEPDCLGQIEKAIACRVVKFSNQRYAATLATSDVAVSPKRLINAYEMGHTEYKITLGMAAGLPVVASPQQSYIEAIGHRGGGILADTVPEWTAALIRLAADTGLRRELGDQARRTVAEKYSTPVVARQYLSLLRDLAGVPLTEEAAS